MPLYTIIPECISNHMSHTHPLNRFFCLVPLVIKKKNSEFCATMAIRDSSKGMGIRKNI